MAEIILYGIIGDPVDKLDSATVTAAIRAATGPLTVRINSPGGFVMEGLAIVAALRAYPGKVTVHIDGMAASMAGVIAAVGAEIIMAESALMMIHNPWDCVCGDAPELRRSADQLDRLRDQIVGIYAKRTGIPEGELVAMMAAETWFTADEALAKGFVTSIAAPLKIAAMAKATGFGFRHVPTILKQQEGTMPEQQDTTQAAVAQERTRISTIMALGTKHDIPTALTQDIISRGLPLDQARAAILDHLATEGDRLNIGHTRPGGHATLDNPATYNEAIRDALVAKISGTSATGAATEFQGMTVVDIARDVLSRRGERDVHRIGADRVINAAMSMRSGDDRGFGGSRNAIITHTTSDFPDLVGGAAEKYLVDRYKLLVSPLKQLARRRDVPDFLTHYGVQVDDWGALDTVNEAGEFKSRTLSTRKNGYNVQTFGNMFSVTRQMLANDHLTALADILQIMAAGAAETEATLLAALINTNAPFGDGKAFFHANHGNLAAAGGAPSVTTLDNGRLAMRSQKNSEGRIIDANPKFLLVPVSLQTSAETLVASTIAPATTADVNPFANKLTPIADPRLVSPASWYLFADPALTPALQYSYLNGQEAPFTDTQEGWRVDGTEYKVRHDFGAGWVDYRYAFKNAGA